MAAPPAKVELLERLGAEIAYVAHRAGLAPDVDVVDRLMAQAEDGLARLLGDGPEAVLDDAALCGLEAVIRTDGSRPVLFVIDDFVDLMAPSIGEYAAVLSRFEDPVRTVCAAVGRVDDPSVPVLGYAGTCWVLGDGLVATNRHVLESICEPGAMWKSGRFVGRLKRGIAVQFGHELGAPRNDRRFPLAEIVMVAPPGRAKYAHPEVGGVNFDGIDLAVLRLAPVPGRRFPPPLPVARGDDPAYPHGRAQPRGRVYLVGYPGNRNSTTPDLFAQIFASTTSFKRLAPGEITVPPGRVAHDPRGSILCHDASTLGGNSGSVVADMTGDGQTALGLHIGGWQARENWAVACERIGDVLHDHLPRPSRAG